jgi:hypothetical protein
MHVKVRLRQIKPIPGHTHGSGGMIAKLKQKLKVANKAVTELEELLAGIGSE